jgi:hypothetical protein
MASIILVFIVLLGSCWFTLDRIPLEHSRAPPDNGAPPLLDGDAGTRCRVVVHAWSWRQVRGACYGASAQKPTLPWNGE